MSSCMESGQQRARHMKKFKICRLSLYPMMLIIMLLRIELNLRESKHLTGGIVWVYAAIQLK